MNTEFATVTQSNPLLVRLDRDSVSVSAQSMGSHVLGARLLVLAQGSSLYVLRSVGSDGSAVRVVGQPGAPAFENGWLQYTADAAYGSAGFRLDPASGIVTMRGLIRSGTAAAVAFTLPAGFRPGFTTNFATVRDGVFGELRLLANGGVVPVNGASAWFAISCSFRAEQ